MTETSETSEARRSMSRRRSIRCSMSTTWRLLRSVQGGPRGVAQIRPHQIAAFIGPSGCGKTTVLRCFNRMNDLIAGARVEGSQYTASTCTPRRLGNTGSPPHRDGLPKAQPVPEEHLRQRRLRPRIAGGLKKSELDEIVEESLRGAALWEEVKDRLKSSGARSVGRPAATPVHRPGAGGASRK